jgi:serine/threonine-protein kinase HipA
LSPAYDHIATALVIPSDEEELALTLNGKKKKIKKNDFEMAIERAGISLKARENIFKKFSQLLDEWVKFIAISFLPEEMKNDYIELVKSRWARIYENKQAVDGWQ